jgi:hypothetical protein
MTTREFADAVSLVIDDDTYPRRLSTRNLIIMMGVLSAVIEWIETELKRRKR